MARRSHLLLRPQRHQNRDQVQFAKFGQNTKSKQHHRPHLTEHTGNRIASLVATAHKKVVHHFADLIIHQVDLLRQQDVAKEQTAASTDRPLPLQVEIHGQISDPQQEPQDEFLILTWTKVHREKLKQRRRQSSHNRRPRNIHSQAETFDRAIHMRVITAMSQDAAEMHLKNAEQWLVTFLKDFK